MKKVKRNWTVLLQEDTRVPIEKCRREQAFDCGLTGHTIYVGVDNKDVTVWRRDYILKALGPRLFWKLGRVQTFGISKGKCYGDLGTMIPHIIKAFNLDWLKTNDWCMAILGTNKDMWKAILHGKITNPEMLCKAFSRRYFRGAYSYRALKMWATCRIGYAKPSLWQTYYYTKNPDLTLREICRNDIEASSLQLFHDVLSMAEFFNEVIDVKWSVKRLEEVHQKQIEKKNIMELERIPNKPVASPFKNGGLELILNERTCYLEGCTMHNCVHSCYWRRIKAGSYLIARGTVNGTYVDVGINTYRDTFELDQVHKIYNGEVGEDIKRYCDTWISDNLQVLDRTVKEIKVGKPSAEYEPDDIIPF